MRSHIWASQNRFFFSIYTFLSDTSIVKYRTCLFIPMYIIIRIKNKNTICFQEDFEMNDVVKYLQECGTFYLATVEGDQPHVRPFGAVCEFEGKLYIVTNNKKDVYNQMKVNGKVEMCGMNKGTWIRVKGAVKEDTRREARVAMMEANKNALQSMYTVDDNLMTVFVFESGIATIYSFTEEPKVINL